MENNKTKNKWDLLSILATIFLQFRVTAGMEHRLAHYSTRALMNYEFPYFLSYIKRSCYTDGGLNKAFGCFAFGRLCGPNVVTSSTQLTVSPEAPPTHC